LNKPLPKILIIVVTSLLTLCCGIGIVSAALGGGANSDAKNGPDRATPQAVDPTSTVPVNVAAPTTGPTTTSAPAPAPTIATTTKPPTPKTSITTKKPTTTTTTSATIYKNVHPGAFCSPHWAYGRTSTGVPMQCKPSTTDSRFRWRKV
jgi:hypothetical protein